MKNAEVTTPATTTLADRLAYRPKEAAVALGISPRKLWELTNIGAVPHVRLGRAIVYPVSLLEKWLAEQATGGTKP
jgi:excisionase family DNA binding protein